MKNNELVGILEASKILGVSRDTATVGKEDCVDTRQ